eukprot:scaffold35170_cov48-Phaeocystis_antarctica.AAC.1
MGGTSSGQHAGTTTRELDVGPVNLAGIRSAQPVPASQRPPRAAHRPAAARAPRTTPDGVGGGGTSSGRGARAQCVYTA